MKTILSLIICFILLSLPLQAQKKAKQEVKFSLPENSSLKRYTDSSFEATVNSSDISIHRNAKEILTNIEARNLKEQHRLWFDILMRSYGSKRDNELVTQNKLLSNVTTQEPLTADKALSCAQKLAENGYTPENTSQLLQEKGINVIEQVLHGDYPLHMVLFSPTIVVGKVVEKREEVVSVFFITTIIAVEKVLKGDTTLKKISIREMYSEDGIPMLESNDRNVLFLQETTQSINKKNSTTTFERIADFPLTVIRDGRKYSVIKEGIDKTNDICKDLKYFFQSQILKK